LDTRADDSIRKGHTKDCPAGTAPDKSPTSNYAHERMNESHFTGSRSGGE
jgi:hypothetical protein